MNKQTYKVEGMHCHSCEVLIKEGLVKFSNIKSFEVSEPKGEVFIEYDGEKPSPEKLNEIFKEEKFFFSDKEEQKESKIMPVQGEARKIEETKTVNLKNTKEHIYKVEGMHCASCEILIEKKLLDIDNVKAVDASTGKGEVVVQYEGNRPNPDRLTKMFKEENYSFYDLNSKKEEKIEKVEAGKKPVSNTLVAFNIALFLIIAFLILDRMGISGFLSLNSTSSLFAFFGFGLLAGISSCAALVGGIVLSMSKQWQSLYSEDSSTSRKLQPHIMFNTGRVVSYAVLGGVLGIIGSRLQISLQFTSFLIVAISFLMIALGLQMLGVKAFRKFQIAAPKSFTRGIANESNFKGKYMPFIMGALTFFLPCGFTITAQGLALLSGSWISGALIMGAFALGTVPILLFIGLSSVKFSSKPHLAERFSKVAGFLVLFFALFNISNQMTVLGFTGFNFSQNQNISASQDGLPPIVDGKQVIQMTASGSGDSPNYFKVKVGVPVKWEITGGNSLGCNGAIISAKLFDGQVDLTPGQVAVKEFTPQTPGTYGFSCTMGMIRGTIEVVSGDNASSDSGAKVVSVAVASTGDTATPAAITDQTQVIQMTASGSGDSPNYFKVTAGVPVRWEITAAGSMGCNNAIISNSLFDGQIPMIPGQVAVKEFTPQTPGKYKFSCTMGMISGIIEVVAKGGSQASATSGASDSQAIPSGSHGCGCGGGGGNTCGGV